MVAYDFSPDDLVELAQLVGEAWLAGANRDWTARAGTLEWDCHRTADHAVDTVIAPAFFLASRRTDRYPDMGPAFLAGPDATVEQLVERLGVAANVLSAVISAAEPDDRAILFRRPEVLTAPPADFAPRGGTELILHAHDVCAGLGVPFEPPTDLCMRLRDHTRSWPMWTIAWDGLPETDDPWGDLLAGSGRGRQRTQ